MVIEYNGTILRNEVAIMKEKIYRSQVKWMDGWMVTYSYILQFTPVVAFVN